MAATCPSCGRPVALTRPQCLYCAAPLPASVVEEATRAAEAALTPSSTDVAGQAGPPRALLFLNHDGIDAGALAKALGLSAFEAGQRARRGGWQLQRIALADDAARDAERLGGAGLRALVLPEAEVRAAARPVAVSGGFWDSQGLTLRTEGGAIRAGSEAVLLVVRGAITREYAPKANVRRLRTATLEPGYRFHLHRQSDPRPLELDPAAFDFGVTSLTESSLLLLSAWVEKLGGQAPVDDRFRREPPALAPAAPEPGIAATLGAGGERRDDESQVLDNLEQFRFYSAWRAAVLRRSR